MQIPSVCDNRYCDPKRIIPDCCRNGIYLGEGQAPLCQFHRDAEEVVRFHWESSSSGNAVISITGASGRAVVEWARIYLMEDSPAGSRRLSLPEWDSVKAAMDACGFYDERQDSDRFGLDGSTWTIEARRGGTYNRVTSWSPPAGPFRRLGLQLASIAGLRTLIEKN